MDGYVVVGALARIDTDRKQETCALIEALDGFSAFEVEDPLKLGVLIEASSLDEAHERFVDQLTAVDGVMGAWPVSVDSDDGLEDEAFDPQSLMEGNEAVPDPALVPTKVTHPESETHTPSFKSEASR